MLASGAPEVQHPTPSPLALGASRDLQPILRSLRVALLAAWFLTFAAGAAVMAFRVMSPLLATLISAVWAVPLLGWSASWLREHRQPTQARVLRGAMIPYGLLAIAAAVTWSRAVDPGAFVLAWLTILSSVVPIIIALSATTFVALTAEPVDTHT